MKTQFILIANAGIARLFIRDASDGLLQPVATLEHPSSPHPGGDGARSGHSNTDSRPGGVAFEPHLDAQHKARKEFAEQLAARVEQELASDRFNRLVVFASSPFLGDLRAHLGPGAVALLGAAINLDLTSFGLVELEARITEAMAAHRH